MQAGRNEKSVESARRMDNGEEHKEKARGKDSAINLVAVIVSRCDPE
jgi:hypothetical protein